MSTARPPFHLAFPVRDLAATREFYCAVLGCAVGREDARWIDFDFFGHQITAHLAPFEQATSENPVDGDRVPVRHFGAVLEWNEWQALKTRLESLGVAFLIAPRVRFAGQVGEQATLFITDPGGNAIEFKSFRDPARLFAREA